MFELDFGGYEMINFKINNFWFDLCVSANQ